MNDNAIIINVAAEFTTTPGGRFKNDGEFSGEEFREKFLVPKYNSLTDGQKLIVNLDGGDGYAISFLEEAFGGLVRQLGKSVIGRIEIISNEEPDLIDKIRDYMNGVSK